MMRIKHEEEMRCAETSLISATDDRGAPCVTARDALAPAEISKHPSNLIKHQNEKQSMDEVKTTTTMNANNRRRQRAAFSSSTLKEAAAGPLSLQRTRTSSSGSSGAGTSSVPSCTSTANETVTETSLESIIHEVVTSSSRTRMIPSNQPSAGSRRHSTPSIQERGPRRASTTMLEHPKGIFGRIAPWMAKLALEVEAVPEESRAAKAAKKSKSQRAAKREEEVPDDATVGSIYMEEKLGNSSIFASTPEEEEEDDDQSGSSTRDPILGMYNNSVQAPATGLMEEDDHSLSVADLTNRGLQPPATGLSLTTPAAPSGWSSEQNDSNHNKSGRSSYYQSLSSLAGSLLGRGGNRRQNCTHPKEVPPAPPSNVASPSSVCDQRKRLETEASVAAMSFASTAVSSKKQQRPASIAGSLSVGFSSVFSKLATETEPEKPMDVPVSTPARQSEKKKKPALACLVGMEITATVTPPTDDEYLMCLMDDDDPRGRDADDDDHSTMAAVSLADMLQPFEPPLPWLGDWEAATRIQSQCRMHCASARFEKTVYCVVRIQTVFRTFCARQAAYRRRSAFQTLRVHFIPVALPLFRQRQRLRHDSATVLQEAFLGYRTKRRRESMLAAAAAASKSPGSSRTKSRQRRSSSILARAFGFGAANTENSSSPKTTFAPSPPPNSMAAAAAAAVASLESIDDDEEEEEPIKTVRPKWSTTCATNASPAVGLLGLQAPPLPSAPELRVHDDEDANNNSRRGYYSSDDDENEDYAIWLQEASVARRSSVQQPHQQSQPARRKRNLQEKIDKAATYWGFSTLAFDLAAEETASSPVSSPRTQQQRGAFPAAPPRNTNLMMY